MTALQWNETNTIFKIFHKKSINVHANYKDFLDKTSLKLLYCSLVRLHLEYR